MEENKLGYQISKKYSHELNEIGNKLRQLENGRIYELSNATMDGYLATNIGQLRSMIEDLLSKIQNGKDGTSEELAKALNLIEI